ncbi:MAG: hypothetical protein Q9160_008965 [Pyrenula sp. 1 TL-2023]
MSAQITFLGMGGIAQAMTANLVRHGNLEKPLCLFNRTKSRAESHSRNIGRSYVASSINEAVLEADIVWSCLQDDEAVQTTFEEILATDIQGKLFVDSSSITPEKTNQIAGKVVGAGGEFVAMPGTYVARALRPE